MLLPSLTSPATTTPATADVLLLVAFMLLSFARDLAVVAYSTQICILISTIFRSTVSLFGGETFKNFNP